MIHATKPNSTPPNSTTPNAYDQIPYPSLSYAGTHPSHLAVLAAILGMKPAPVTACRVLEVGCASGGNLIPMAYALPGSSFVGVDYSARQIDAGQAWRDQLQLENVKLLAADIRNLDDSLGEFDFIIAHGVYSWTPPDVRDALLALCGRQLAPNGVAFVSYNTYPGWHMTGIIRDAMTFHTLDEPEPLARAQAGKVVCSLSRRGDPHRKERLRPFFQGVCRDAGAGHQGRG
ncbi:MAG: class I SAM-dependent methyltransferase [Caldilineaceae bacterium]|nr:class I SAM-dependent methyltransferase [Caldilineaceae bacterium]